MTHISRAHVEKPKHETGAQPRSIKSSIERSMYVSSDELTWRDAPAHLPAGTKIALLDGDPAIPDRLFTMRLKLPAGARLAPHWHSSDEHVSVISGEFLSGEGNTFDDAAMKVMPAGSYYAFPAGHHHFAVAATESVIQMHGVGPWELLYVNPADDPRHH